MYAIQITPEAGYEHLPTGFYVADNEDATPNVKKALKFKTAAAAEAKAENVRGSWFYVTVTVVKI